MICDIFYMHITGICNICIKVVSWSFIHLGEQWGSRGNKTHCFPWGQSLSTSCYIPSLSLNKTSTVIGWFLVTCPWSNSNVSRPGYHCSVVARAPNTTARDQCMTKFKMAWSSARDYVSLIDGDRPENTASFQFKSALIEVVPSWFVFPIIMIV